MMRTVTRAQRCENLPVCAIPPQTALQKREERRVRASQRSGQVTRSRPPLLAPGVRDDARLQRGVKEHFCSCAALDQVARRHADDFHYARKLLYLVLSRKQGIPCISATQRRQIAMVNGAACYRTIRLKCIQMTTCL